MPVKGVKLGHFYAFFSRAARENDYLRGRLDAAEQLTRLLLATADSDEPLTPACKPLLQGILDEDDAALTKMSRQSQPSANKSAASSGRRSDLTRR